MLRVFLCAVLKADKQKSLFSKNGKRAFLHNINREKRGEYLLLFQKNLFMREKISLEHE